jgi:hypothetical protein
MRRFITVSSILGLAVGATHCAASANIGELKTRAAFDLACAGDSLQLQPFGERTVGVEGCGRRATYVWAFQNQSWLLDSRTGSESPAAAPPSSLAPAAPGPVAPSTAPPAQASAPIAPLPAAPAKPAAAATPAAAPPGDPKACESAQDYKRRAVNASGAAQAQLLKMAEKKEAECRAQGKGP